MGGITIFNFSTIINNFLFVLLQKTIVQFVTINIYGIFLMFINIKPVYLRYCLIYYIAEFYFFKKCSIMPNNIIDCVTVYKFNALDVFSAY